MLAKIIDYNKYMVRVTQLDIDDYGSIIPVGDVELLFSPNNLTVYEILKNSTYAAIFTEKDIYNEGSVDLGVDVNIDNIILVIPMTIDELNDEKKKVIESAGRYKE
jgi:hypothetical protein